MSGISQVQIANMALSNIGSKSSITSITEQSAEARQCNIWWEYTLRQCLASYDWSFARKRLTLSTAGEASPDDEQTGAWAYRYQYPADCIALRRIWNPSGEQADAIPYDVETDSTGTRTIVTNLDAAVAVYTMYQPATTFYTPFFVDFLGRMLAARIAWPLTKSNSVVQQQNQAAAAILRAAPSYDANERVGDPPRDAEWIRARTFQYPVPPFSRVY